MLYFQRVLFTDYLENSQTQRMLVLKIRMCYWWLVKKDIHSPGPWTGELVPIPHTRNKFCTLSKRDERVWKCVPIPNGLEEGATFINISISNGDLKCWWMMIHTATNHGDKVIRWYTGFTFQTFIKKIWVCCLSSFSSGILNLNVQEYSQFHSCSFQLQI